MTTYFEDYGIEDLITLTDITDTFWVMKEQGIENPNSEERTISNMNLLQEFKTKISKFNSLGIQSELKKIIDKINQTLNKVNQVENELTQILGSWNTEQNPVQSPVSTSPTQPRSHLIPTERLILQKEKFLTCEIKKSSFYSFYKYSAAPSCIDLDYYREIWCVKKLLKIPFRGLNESSVQLWGRKKLQKRVMKEWTSQWDNKTEVIIKEDPEELVGSHTIRRVLRQTKNKVHIQRLNLDFENFLTVMKMKDTRKDLKIGDWKCKFYYFNEYQVDVWLSKHYSVLEIKIDGWRGTLENLSKEFEVVIMTLSQFRFIREQLCICKTSDQTLRSPPDFYKSLFLEYNFFRAASMVNDPKTLY